MSVLNKLMRQLPILIAIVAIAFLAGQYVTQRQMESPQQQLELARKAMSEGREDIAAELLRPLAEKGNAKAQYALGHLYAIGLGVKQDPTTAEQWLQLSAEQGYPPAGQQLGEMYRDGDGIDQNFAKALNWFQKASVQGSAAGQRDLGELYQYGWGVSADPVKAYAWYELAARSGDRMAPHLRDALAVKLDDQQLSAAEDEVARLQATVKNDDKG